MFPDYSYLCNEKHQIMNNNDIMRRIRFSFDYSDSEMINIFALADFGVSRADVSDWLKRDDDPEFLELKDIQLAVFLNGLIILNRGRKEGEQPEPEKRLNNNMIFRKLKIALNLNSDEMLELLHSQDKKISKHELSAFFRNSNHNSYKPCLDQYLRNLLNALQQKSKN